MHFISPLQASAAAREPAEGSLARERTGGCQAVCSLGLSEKIKIFTYDNVNSTIDLIKQGIITATICQQPFLQGYRPLELIARYLLEGIAPETELQYVDIDIRIRENI